MIDHARGVIKARQERLADRFAWLRVALETRQADRRMAGSVMAAGVAFRLFLMILPLALLTAAVLGFANTQVGGSPGHVAHQFGLTFAIAQIISSSAKEATQGRWLLLTTGVMLLLWTGNGVVQALNSAFRVAWNLEAARARSPAEAIIVVGTLALAVVVSMAVAAVGSARPAREVTLTGLVAIGYFVAWMIISWQLPRPTSRWVALVPGAVLVAVGLTTLHLGTVLFAADRVARASRLYGSLGFVSTLMLWLFLTGRIMVGSAQVNAMLWRRSRAGAERPPRVDRH